MWLARGLAVSASTWEALARAAVAGANRNFSTALSSEGGVHANLSDTRGVLRLSGKDLFTFLQGILTNDIFSLGKDVHSTMYAAKLDHKGRVQQDLVIYRMEASSHSDAICMDVDKENLEGFLKELRRYRLRSDVDIEDVSGDCCVWSSFGAEQDTSETGALDPRLRDLGTRCVRSASWSPSNGNAVDASSYKVLRMTHGVAEGMQEIPRGKALPLEYNMDGLHGISFTKGCYVGQELTARTHFQGQIRKRVMPVRLVGHQADVEVGADVVVDAGGKSIGQIRAQEQGRGLAFLRLSDALTVVNGERGHLWVKDTGVKVLPEIPRWWPDRWHGASADQSVASC